MNSSFLRKGPCGCLQGNPQGFALVIVLISLVLFSAVVLAFLAGVRTDQASSSSYSASTSTKILSDSVLSLVIGQIRVATERTGQTWTSQPGMIRTFTPDGPDKMYKLYSAKLMVAPGTSDPTDDLPTADWKSRPNEYVDLNEPIYGRFPIFDPSVVDPTNPEIEGIEVDYPHVPGLSAFTNKSLPMPVRWLYVLQDGGMAWSDVSNQKGFIHLTLLNGTVVPPTNRPVARIAFWTDDETCKLNVNTASEGTYWDTPLASLWNNFPKPAEDGLVFETDLALSQPVQREYQRYPGHPAQTCLTPVLDKVIRRYLGGSPSIKDVNEIIYQLTPRIQGGTTQSSYSGTVNTTPLTTPLNWDADRLYATVDDYVFQPLLSAGGTRVANPFGDSTEDRCSFANRAKFFLTTASKAPETTLLGMPRVAIWPVSSQPAKRSPFEKLLVFCSSVGKQGSEVPFYVQRTDPNSPIIDFSLNSQLYDYLKLQTAAKMPGFGQLSFLDKYPSGNLVPDGSSAVPTERDQILTEVLDYIRCLNLQSSEMVGGTSIAYTPVGSAGGGQVVPLRPANGTSGFGRFLTLSELVIVLTQNAKDGSNTNPPYQYSVALIPELFSPMAGYSVLRPNMQVTFKNLDSITITALDAGNNVIDQQAPIASSATFTINQLAGLPPNGYTDKYWKFGGTEGPWPLMTSSGQTFPSGNVSFNQKPVKFKVSSGSTAIEVGINNIGNNVPVYSFSFKFPEFVIGGIKAPRGYGSFADPTSGRYKSDGSALFDNTSQNAAGDDGVRSLLPAADINQGSNKPAVDIQGDCRFTAAFRTPGQFFGPCPQYFNTLTSFNNLQTLRTAAYSNSFYPNDYMSQAAYGNAPSGCLVAGITGYKPNARPDVPPQVQGVKLAGADGNPYPGDWDNGPAQLPDGPYVNKADEGADKSASASANADFAGVSNIPYLNIANVLFQGASLGQTRFSPNRQISSPVMFGSLPTGLCRGKPWQTLLFRPLMASLPGGLMHPGGPFGGPPDYLLLDSFWMPVVEPYPISERFATSGKINLNEQIAPFSYIKRDSALRGLLKSVMVTALDADQATSDPRPLVYFYKDAGAGALGLPNKGNMVRRSIDLDSTMKIIWNRLENDKKPFIAESEICDIPLVPKDVAGQRNAGVNATDSISSILSKVNAFWTQHLLTGDNSLERPYSLLYPRLTTRSNTFSVHMRVQRIQASLSNDGFLITPDSTRSELRGAYSLERYLDPNLTEYVPGKPLGPYKFRVTASQQDDL